MPSGKIFAAIDVGSYELSMKIFELSSKNGMREIDCIRQRVELGTETYITGKISSSKVDEICRVLKEFSQIMKGYHADAYKAYGTSAIREMENGRIILDQIAIRTGIKIDVLSNSEQRFLDYKSVASKSKTFHKVMEKGTAIVDIGGGSIQISLFDKDVLVTTQNIRLGVLRLWENLRILNAKPSAFEELLDEMAITQLDVFKKLHLKEKLIPNLIIVDDYLSPIIQKNLQAGMELMNLDVFEKIIQILRSKPIGVVAREWNIPEEQAIFTYISAMMIKSLASIMNTECIWAPGVALCDGIAYEYAQKEKFIIPDHNFEQDIIGCAMNISKRYMGSRKRAETLEQITMTIFDGMKKVHGLGKRERLLLQIAVILHDCGKYISLVNLADCSYNIIMSTEIIGLSHLEREIVANVVKYNHSDFDYYVTMSQNSTLDSVSYLTIAKLTAILRVANALDRSHRQKFKNVKAALKDNELIITTDTTADTTLERGLFTERAAFFEEVYSIKPVIRQKKIN